MDSRFQYILQLYEKYKNNSASEVEIDELFDSMQYPQNQKILKEALEKDWNRDEDLSQKSPLKWEDVERGLRRRKASERKVNHARQYRRNWWAVAASLLVVVGLSISIYYFSNTDSALIYSTGFGEVEKIVLDDGSRVTLNANSRLHWKSNWAKHGKRVAVLEGEAFFDIETIRDEAQGGKMAFEVRTEDLTIRVVGTSFNVKSRSHKTDVYLQQGEVALDLNTVKDRPIDSDLSQRIVMKPGESVSYSSTTRNLEKSDSDQYGNASWTVGTFMYSNKSVGEILLSLEEIYGVTFEVEDQKILDRKLTTNLPYSDWPIVESGLELLLQADLIRKEGQIIRIKKQ